LTVVQRLAAFTTDPAGGNPAGVVISAQHPPEDEMQRTASEVGYSETAFLSAVPGQARTYDVRYFSPLTEVPFCGHATIAAGVSLAERDGPGVHMLLTPAGPVSVDVRYDESGQLMATLTSPTPSVEPIDDELVTEVLTAIDWLRTDLDARLPPARASAGASHLVLAARYRSRLAELHYDFDHLRSLMSGAGLVTLHLVWQEDALRYHARDPFPVGGVVEDPATGAAAAAFGAYLRQLGVVTPPCRITITQGEDMGRPSTLLVDLVPGQEPVRVSGHAVPIP
jgi:PhzF family phenazine biosynthesis protein